MTGPGLSSQVLPDPGWESRCPDPLSRLVLLHLHCVVPPEEMALPPSAGFRCSFVRELGALFFWFVSLLRYNLLMIKCAFP